MASRFIGALVLSKVNNVKFFTITSFATVGSLVLVIISPSTGTTLFFIGLTGLVSGNLFPLIFSLTVNKLPEKANEISGLMIMAVVGGAIIAPVIGFFQTFVTASVSLVVLVVCALFISLSSLLHKKLIV